MKTIGAKGVFFSGADTTAFNVLYIQYTKKKYTGIKTYDMNANILDLSIYSRFRKNGPLKEADIQNAQTGVLKDNPGMVYYSDFSVLNNGEFITRPYGILNRMLPENESFKTAESLLKIISIRDYFNLKYPDYFSREEFGRYFIRKMELAAIKNDAYAMDVNRGMALKTAPDVPTMYKTMAAVYFQELGDGPNTVKCLEKAVFLEPYYKPTMNLLINIYEQSGLTEKAVYWLGVLFSHETDPVKKEYISSRINALQKNTAKNFYIAK
jgi:hypothetical protein